MTSTLTSGTLLSHKTGQQAGRLLVYPCGVWNNGPRSAWFLFKYPPRIGFHARSTRQFSRVTFAASTEGDTAYSFAALAAIGSSSKRADSDSFSRSIITWSAADSSRPAGSHSA